VLFTDLCFSGESPFAVEEADLVAVTCLMVSAKNLEMKYPCAHNLNLHVKSKYSEQRIIETEA